MVVELKRSDSDSLMDLQAIRYAAMVANMTFHQATDAHQRYLARREMDGTEAASRIRQHITADDTEADIDSSKPRIFLVSSSFSKELTTSVMWLRQQFGMDITCVKLQPYKSADGLFMESSIIIPIPEVDDYLVRLRNREEEEQRGRGTERKSNTNSRWRYPGWKPLPVVSSFGMQSRQPMITKKTN